MATRMQQRRGTAAQWTAADPILAAGEIGFETDTSQFKIGDGVNTWSSLSYFKNLDGLDVNGFIADSEKGNADGVASLNSDGVIPASQMNTTHIQSEIDTRVALLVGAAPGALDTLNEISAAIGNDPDFIGTLTDAIDLKAPSSSPTFTGVVTLPESNNVIIGTDSLGTIISNLETSISLKGTSESVTNLSAQVNTNEGTLNSLSSTVSSLSQDVIDNTSSINLVEADVTTLLSDVSNNAASIATLTTDVSNNTTDISNLVVSTTTLTSDLSALDTRVTAAESDIDALETSTTSHESLTLNVHGIADTSALATQTDVTNAIASASTYTDTELASYAPLDSAALTGTPTAPTATAGDNSTKIATTAYVDTAVSALVDSAPGALDTLNELAAALGDDANFSTTITNSLAEKAPLASPTFTGTVALPAASSVTLDGIALSTTIDNKADKNASINTMSGSHTAVSADLGNVREMSNGGTFTIPSDNSFWPVGGIVDVLQTGSSQVTIAGGSGVTVNATPGLKLRAQWSSATILKRAANTFVAMGDLSA